MCRGSPNESGPSKERVALKTGDDLRPVAAEERVARIPEDRVAPQVFQSPQHETRFCRLDDKHPLRRLSCQVVSVAVMKHEPGMVGRQGAPHPEKPVSQEKPPGETKVAAVSDIDIRGSGQSQNGDFRPAILSLSSPEGHHHVELPAAQVGQDLLPAGVFQRHDIRPGQLPEAVHRLGIRSAENRQGRLRVQLSGEYPPRFGAHAPRARLSE